MNPWLLAILALIIGLALVLRGRVHRSRRGLGHGRTLALDNRTLYSGRHGLAGRPDRIVSEGGVPIPEEWKSARRVFDSHKAQMGVYFLLIEEETGVAPPYGVIVLGDGTRHEVKNTPELRGWVLNIAEQIRAARRQIGASIPVRQPPAKCRACGMREGCGQRSG